VGICDHAMESLLVNKPYFVPGFPDSLILLEVGFLQEVAGTPGS